MRWIHNHSVIMRRHILPASNTTSTSSASIYANLREAASQVTSFLFSRIERSVDIDDMQDTHAHPNMNGYVTSKNAEIERQSKLLDVRREIMNDGTLQAIRTKVLELRPAWVAEVRAGLGLGPLDTPSDVYS